MIRFRVIAVLFLKDSLTGAPVPASAVRIMAGGLKRLNKGDGIICLVEEGGRNIAPAGKKGAPIPAELHSAIYLTERFSLPADSQTPLMLPLFLLPSMGYPGKQGMTRVFGRAPEGSEVCAVADGTVLSVFDDDMLGRTVTISHEGGYVTHYANLAEEVSVTAGEQVSAGQTIGVVGKTALGEVGSEPHLHFAVYRNNVPQDPEAFLAG